MKNRKFIYYSKFVFVFDVSLNKNVITPIKELETPLSSTPSLPEPVLSLSKIEKTSLVKKSVNTPRVVKRCLQELKIEWRVIRGKHFCSDGFVRNFEYYDPIMRFIVFIKFIYVRFFLNCFCFSFKFSFSYGSFNISYIFYFFYSKSHIKLYSRINLAFGYLFLQYEECLEVLFPNHIIDIPFSSLERFYFFSYYTPLSFKHLRIVVYRRIKVRGKLYLKGLFGINLLSNFNYKGKNRLSPGVKLFISKFFYSNGFISKSYNKILFDPNFFSCFSFSFYYQSIPYTKIFSFKTVGRMGKYCKTFKPEKALQNSSAAKKDKNFKLVRKSYKGFFDNK